MEYTLRKAERQDMPQVLELINQLAEYEKEPEAVEVTVEDLEKNGFGKDALFHCNVVEVEDEIRGMALYYYRYSTWKGRTVHLEDLIIEKNFRGKGLGMALFKKVMEFAVEQNIKRVEWVVLDWNSSAIKFYENAGATVFKSWNTVQFDETSLLKFLEN